ncbi:hypothetical protein [Corynebacterium epidermidicanis]|uniref:Phytase-like domain-containing protein n=1 Tax=Corynebacterium epidermidicanis TaxID=1050174 RepID=A0A0G3GWB8_9CORY|nr:hypothetical protein [Corynebacterium epidermidicanis]AKK03117.1 hypothetical protein CEPID_06285 [Corynebacterium epidermidicanis]
MARLRLLTLLVALLFMGSACASNKLPLPQSVEVHSPIEVAASGRGGKVFLFQFSQDGVQKDGEFNKAGDFVGLARSERAKVFSAGEFITIFDSNETRIPWDGLDFRPVSKNEELYFFSSIAQSTNVGWRTHVAQFDSQGQLETTSVPGRLDNVIICENEKYGLLSEIVAGEAPEPMYLSKLALGEESGTGVLMDLPDNSAWSALPGIAVCSNTRDGKPVVKQVFQSRPYDGSTPRLMIFEISPDDGSLMGQYPLREVGADRSTRVVRANGFAKSEPDGSIITVDHDAIRRYKLNSDAMEEIWRPSIESAEGSSPIQAFDIQGDITAIATMTANKSQDILYIDHEQGKVVSQSELNLPSNVQVIDAIALG